MHRLLDGFGSVTSLGHFACRATKKSAADADHSGNWSKLPVGLLRSSTRAYECGLPRLHRGIKFSYFGLTRAVCQDHSNNSNIDLSGSASSYRSSFHFAKRLQVSIAKWWQIRIAGRRAWSKARHRKERATSSVVQESHECRSSSWWSDFQRVRGLGQLFFWEYNKEICLLAGCHSE
ncbi:hypothetical protein HN011_005796 [Eciton burchellii]|nr:hypothetical protein HN011_005796 [Eciton burchellii]